MNGVASPAVAGTYCVLERQWQRGDRVTIDLDMRLRAWTGERECAGKVSLYHGPLLLAYDHAPAATHQRPGQWQNFGKLFASRTTGTAFEYDFEGEGIKWFGRRFDDAGRARVLIDGREVALVDQYGPVREAPFTWEYQGLAPGQHTLRIEVTGARSPASRDTWSNVVGFGPPGAQQPASEASLHALDMKNLKATLVDVEHKEVEHKSDDALIRMDITDATGHVVHLRDFGTAGHGGVPYSSWLPALNARPTPFTRENPLRSVVVDG
ncbi:MAG: glycoside hydrolase family 127 protein [Abitibacteriaceae bacterium]|nr:glycoside hydrolase family 127 protein [Abditibacteriaceae bacterium]